MRVRHLWIFFIFISLFSFRLWSYPGYIGYGYGSCLTCHYNPLGNGPLRAYGRAVQATEIAGNFFDADAELLATQSGFVFGPLPEWLQLQGSYRGLYLTRGLESNPQSNWISMQAEGSATVSFSKELLASATVGYTPLPSNLSPSQAAEIGNLISREHYLGVLPEKGWGVYLGLMDPAFGLRIPDHNAFIRSNLLLNINDQTHGVLVHHDWQQGEAALHLFAGKLFQESERRQKGLSFVSEFLLAENTRAGISGWYSTSDFRSRQMAAGHLRMQVGRGSSLIAELGSFRETRSNQDNSTVGLFSFLRSRHLLTKGLFGLMTFETYFSDISKGSARFFRAGPSLEFLPFQKVELRVDFSGTQTMGTPSVAFPTYNLQVQTHVWL